jgi:hypothetical protein
MTVCLFIGPTLRREDVRLSCDPVCLPPVAQGDVWRAARLRPRAIGIVDGYFSGAPSVWHKEILWALSEGIHVFGSASMGALRAAELHGFGMRGVGRIFEAFRDGELEDDDEVAVVHGPAELGYPPLSEAMVNIRATLVRAEAEGVLSGCAREGLEGIAKALHFPERRWPALLAAGTGHGATAAEIAALRAWLPQGRVDLKRADALEMLRAIDETLAADTPPAAPFRFEWTHFWDELVSRPDAPAGDAGSPEGRVLEELRLEGPEALARVRERALLRLLAVREAERLGLALPEGAVAEVLTRLRRGHGLYTRAALDGWLAANGLDPVALERLAGEEARLEAVTESAGRALAAAMLDELRLAGEFGRLAERARQKDAAAAAAPAPTPLELRLWYFEVRLGRPMPEDIAAYARAQGFGSVADFDSALWREHVYVRTCGQKAEG